MLWYDTSANILKMRTEADDAWINIGYLDQSADAFRIFDDTQVVNTGGTQTGLIGDQTTGTWETGTGTTESLVSPAKVKAAVLAHAPSTSYTDAEARTAQSGHSAGDVGSYAWLSYSNSSGTTVTFNPGGTTGGSSLKYLVVVFLPQQALQAHGNVWVTYDTTKSNPKHTLAKDFIMTYKLGNKSLQKLEGVHPDLVAVVKQAIEITKQDLSVIEGIRSYERQKELVNKGIQDDEPRHLTGHAVDLALPLSWDGIFLPYRRCHEGCCTGA